jgi:hypothetical protein
VNRGDLARMRWAAAVPKQTKKTNEKEKHMLYTIAVVLIILWLLGLVTSYTMGGVIHLLLVVALVMVLLNFFGNRRGA